MRNECRIFETIAAPGNGDPSFARLCHAGPPTVACRKALPAGPNDIPGTV